MLPMGWEGGAGGGDGGGGSGGGLGGGEGGGGEGGGRVGCGEGGGGGGGGKGRGEGGGGKGGGEGAIQSSLPTQMFPVSATAAIFVPSADTVIACQFLLCVDGSSVQDHPASVDIQIEPEFTTAASRFPSADDETAFQS